MEVSYNQKTGCPLPSPSSDGVLPAFLLASLPAYTLRKSQFPSLRSATPGPSPRTVFSATKPSDLFPNHWVVVDHGILVFEAGKTWGALARYLSCTLPPFRGRKGWILCFFPNCVSGSGSKSAVCCRGADSQGFLCAGDGRQMFFFFTLFFSPLF